jgi:hypothetical protein
MAKAAEGVDGEGDQPGEVHLVQVCCGTVPSALKLFAYGAAVDRLSLCSIRVVKVDGSVRSGQVWGWRDGNICGEAAVGPCCSKMVA